MLMWKRRTRDWPGEYLHYLERNQQRAWSNSRSFETLRTACPTAVLLKFEWLLQNWFWMPNIVFFSPSFLSTWFSGEAVWYHLWPIHWCLHYLDNCCNWVYSPNTIDRMSPLLWWYFWCLEICLSNGIIHKSVSVCHALGHFYKITAVTFIFRSSSAIVHFDEKFEMCDIRKCHNKDGRPGRSLKLKKNKKTQKQTTM